jgi:HSP20 family protein
MSFWTRFPGEREVAPLFRILDELDNVRRLPRSSAIRAFQPKFDVKELRDTYELYGELPGINQKDIEIEFTDPHTLVIRGRTERSFSKGAPPAGLVEGAQEPGRIAEESFEHVKHHKPVVEDENAAEESTATKTTATTVADPQSQKKEVDEAKYWVSERSVGEFHRSFTFPHRVDQDAVRASMKNGILSIVVPKMAEQQSRKITIE